MTGQTQEELLGALLEDQKIDVEKPQSEFTLKIENSAPEHRVVLTREYRGELVEVLGYIRSCTTGKDSTDLYVTISNNGESFLKFQCFCTSDSISIRRIGIINSKYSKDDWPYNDGDDVVEFNHMDENMKKAFFEYLEIRGIKPSIVDFMIKCYRYKKAKKMSTLGSFVPDFEFSSAAGTKKCSSNESLLQAIDSELKRIGHVEETPSEFSFELNRDFNKGGRAYVELTKEFQGELVRLASGYIFGPQSQRFEFEDFTVTISKHGGSRCGSRLQFDCSYTLDGISISNITVVDGGQYLEFELDMDENENENVDGDQYLELELDEDENVDENKNLKKALQKYLEVRGIKPSNIEFIFKCISNKYTQINLTVLKKMKNFIGQIA
ncbi:hypothetical protein QYF36_010054 [Acer negundo]|nr:hypothetical protein QYF36_010054 [Acer negundo]